MVVFVRLSICDLTEENKGQEKNEDKIKAFWAAISNLIASFRPLTFFFPIPILTLCISNFRLPTDIQSEAIPAILGGGDVLMVCFYAANYVLDEHGVWEEGLKFLQLFKYSVVRLCECVYFRLFVPPKVGNGRAIWSRISINSSKISINF